MPASNSDYSDMILCSSCYRIYGYGTYRGFRHWQKCRCPGTPEDAKKQEKWRWFDFNEMVTLCYCCGLELLRSGSRWSIWFCDYCKHQVTDFNGSYGRTIFPIGRHSLMSGVGLNSDEAQRPEQIGQFVSKARGLFASSDHLAEWRRLVVSENLSALGLGSSSDVPLMEYLPRAASLDKSEAFRGMCEFFQADATEALHTIEGTDVLEEAIDGPQSIYTADKEIKCVFFSLVIRRDALDEHYSGGARAFLERHGGYYNDRLVVMCVMGGGDLDEVLTDMRSQLNQDYILFDASLGDVAFPVEWLKGYALDGGTMVRFSD